MKNNYTLKYSPEFLNDFYKIITYIKQELKNIMAGDNLILKVEKEIKKRQKNPEGYQEYKTKAENTYYRIYIDIFIIFYTISKQDKEMEIRRIIYGKRDLDKLI